MDKTKLQDLASASIDSNGCSSGRLNIHSLWTTECYDKDGNLKWVEKDRPNIVTDEGINAMLNIMFHGDAAKNPWYVAIFESNSTPATSDTYDLWADSLVTECNAAYDEETRPVYVEAAATGKAITNSASKAVFTMNNNKTIYGAALVSNSTKGGHVAGDFLFCVSTFAVARSVVNADILRVTIAIAGADS